MRTSEHRNEERLTRLRTHFGHSGFRPGQEEIITAVLGGRDVLAVMPTGSGKSLGYQLPAVMLPGLTLVVSPLISLMKDQVDELNRRGIRSGALHSMLSAEDRGHVLASARGKALRLLYVAPERFASHQFLQCSARSTSRGSSSTKRIACRSGVTTFAPITVVWLLPPRCAGAAMERRGVRRSRRSRRPRRPKCATTSRRCSG